jgi:predicted enzyme related to lactoylglutathione lyase
MTPLGPSPLEFLVSADVLIDDFVGTVAAAQTKLGFGPPKDTWFGGGPGRGFEVVFLRTQPSLKASPTRIEIMAARDIDPSLPVVTTLPHMPGLNRHQAAYPVRTHGTVFAVQDLDAAIERVQRAGLRHWLDAKNDLVPHHRLWIGVTESAKDEWIPGDDGGLLIELVDAASIPGVVESAAVADPTPWGELAPGALVRVIDRQWLVPDVDASRDRLHASLGFELGIAEPVTNHAGARQITIRCAHPRSATVTLMTPTAGTVEHEYVAAHGPVPWRIVIAVNDLDAKAKDLSARGTPYRRIDDDRDGQPSLAVHLDVLGAPVSFIAATES